MFNQQDPQRRHPLSVIDGGDVFDGDGCINPYVFRLLSSNTESNLNIPQRTRESFKTLDRSLKAFLRSSNLPGLEYRLRMAGLNTLSDLLDTDVDTLCGQGFTPLMAQRLLRALDDYILGHLSRTEGLQLPFQLVRKGQKINSDPTEKMKAMPTFGKRNLKRQPDTRTSKKLNSSMKSQGGKVANQKRPMSYLRLMSEENLPIEPIFPNVLSVEEDQQSSSSEQHLSMVEGVVNVGVASLSNPVEVSVAGQGEGMAELGINSVDPLPGHAVGLKVGQLASSFQELFLPLEEIDTAGNRWKDSDNLRQKLRRSNSIPSDYRFYFPVSRHSPWNIWYHVRSYSSPPSLAPLTSETETILASLSTSQELKVVMPALHQLCTLLRSSETSRKEAKERGCVAVIVDLLASLCINQKAVELSFKIIKYLTRTAFMVGEIPSETVPAILHGMECHPTNEKILIEGCLALGNTGRAAPSECHQLLAPRSLLTLSQSMESFPSNPTLQVSAMSALSVGLGCWPEGRLEVLSEYGQLLDLVLVAMQNFPSDPQVQEYSCSFMALLMAEVAVEMECGVVQLIVEHVCIAMATHYQCSPVAVWASKALANSSLNAALGDVKLAGRCCDLLAEALGSFPDDNELWTCAVYALLQLTTRNSAVRVELELSGIVSLLKRAPTSLSAQAEEYVEQLLTSFL